MTAASKVTLTRIFLIPVYMVLMYVSGGVAGPWMWGALGVFILASVTDFVDGYIARHCNQVSDFGKFLDPLADKLLVIAGNGYVLRMGPLACLGAYGGPCPGVCRDRPALGGGREGNGSLQPVGPAKGETASTMVGLCLLMASPPHPTFALGAVIWVVVATTLYSGVEYFARNWKCLWN